MKTLAIYGSGGLGREIYELASRANKANNNWSELIFIDDYRAEDIVDNIKYIHFETLLKDKDNYEVVIAVGEPASREILYNKLKEYNVKLATLIDNTAIIAPTAKIGEGSIISEFSSIHCGVVIGNNCLVQPYTLLGHDIKIGNHSVLSVQFAPGGNSNIGDKVYIGMSSTVKENVIIGDNAIISMGSVVLKDVNSGAVVFGNPARVTLGNSENKVFKNNEGEKNE